MKFHEIKSNGDLSYDSKYDVIKNAGVASHPNSAGHKLIAQKFINNMF